jgi:hypothetical protein
VKVIEKSAFQRCGETGIEGYVYAAPETVVVQDIEDDTEN